MRPTERNQSTGQGAPGKSGPAVFAFPSPRPQLLRGFTKESMGFFPETQSPLMATCWSPPEGLLPMLSSELFMPVPGTTNDEKEGGMRYGLVAGADERLGWLGAYRARFGV